VGPKYVKPEVKLNNNWSEQRDPRVNTASPVDVACGERSTTRSWIA
jgi:hypothetical protein